VREAVAVAVAGRRWREAVAVAVAGRRGARPSLPLKGGGASPSPSLGDGGERVGEGSNDASGRGDMGARPWKPAIGEVVIAR
jgi:hypothetical protein